VSGIQTPDEALQALLEGNQRFAHGNATNPNRTLARLQELGTQQAPFAAVLGCSDSRLPVEILFDQGFGDIFVTRLAGNVATSEAIGSLEFATRILGAKLLLVLGHGSCGAVRATLEREVVPGQIGSLYPYIRPAVKAAGDRGVDAVVEENVRNQVDTLRNASPVLAELVSAKKLGIAGGIFDFRTGLVTLV
jgi:carbonic anhydrase